MPSSRFVEARPTHSYGQQTLRPKPCIGIDARNDYRSDFLCGLLWLDYRSRFVAGFDFTATNTFSKSCYYIK